MEVSHLFLADYYSVINYLYLHIVYEHNGLVVGGTALSVGFVWEHPSTTPNIVSSTAAVYAAPQFASLWKLAHVYYATRRATAHWVSRKEY